PQVGTAPARRPDCPGGGPPFTPSPPLVPGPSQRLGTRSPAPAPRPHPISTRRTHGSQEDPRAAGEGTPSLARDPGGPGRGPHAGDALLRGERPGEAADCVTGHLPAGPREGAWPDPGLTGPCANSRLLMTEPTPGLGRKVRTLRGRRGRSKMAPGVASGLSRGLISTLELGKHPDPEM